MGDCLSIHLGASEERKSRVRRWREGSASSLYLPSRSARSRANLFISPLEKKKKKKKRRGREGKGREGRETGRRERERERERQADRGRENKYVLKKKEE